MKWNGGDPQYIGGINLKIQHPMFWINWKTKAGNQLRKTKARNQPENPTSNVGSQLKNQGWKSTEKEYKINLQIQQRMNAASKGINRGSQQQRNQRGKQL